MKYSKKRAQKICELVSSGDYTIADICKSAGIHIDTYYDWRNTKSEFSEALKTAQDKRLDSLAAMAQSGLATLLTKHEYTEVKTEFSEGKPDAEGNSKPKIKSQTKTTKFIMPNPTAVIFALSNRKPDDWKQKVELQHSGTVKIGKELADESYE